MLVSLIHLQHVKSVIYLGICFFPFFMNFIGKDTLFKIPFFGWFMQSHGHIPIYRKNLQSAIKSLQGAGDRVKRLGRNISIAPEGTRRTCSSKERIVQDFKKGPFHLAKASEVDIVPVTLLGAQRLWPAHQINPLSGTVTLMIGNRISGNDVKNLSLDDLMSKVKKSMEENAKYLPDSYVFSNKDKKDYITIFYLFCCLLYILGYTSFFGSYAIYCAFTWIIYKAGIFAQRIHKD